MIYPSYQEVSQQLRDFFGEPDPKVQIPPQPVVLAGDISPAYFHSPFLSSKGGVAAQVTSVGIAVTPGKGALQVEISDLWVLSGDTFVTIGISNEFSGWDVEVANPIARSFEQNKIPNIISCEDSRVGGVTMDFSYLVNVQVVANTWVRIPGVYQISPRGNSGAVCFAQNVNDNLALKIMGNARVLLS